MQPHLLQQKLLLRVQAWVQLLLMVAPSQVLALRAPTLQLLQATRQLKMGVVIPHLASLSYAQYGLILQLRHVHQSPGKLISLGKFNENLSK
jgi:hypothetical protein